MKAILNKMAVALFATCLAVLSARATTYVAIKDKNDWSDPASFTIDGKTATTVPGSEDTVQLPTTATWSFTSGTASFNVMANVKAIRYKAWIYPNIEITVPSGATATINCAVYPIDDSNCYRFGSIVKRGAGTLKLCAGSTFVTSGGGDWPWGESTTACCWNFYSNIRVKEGTVRLLPDWTTQSCYVGLVEVGSGAKFYVPNHISGHPGTNLTCQTRGIKGAGTVASDQTTYPVFDSIPTSILESDFGNEYGELVFTGKFVDESTGGLRVRFSGPQYVKGMGSTNKGVAMVWSNSGGTEAETRGDHSVTTVDKLGMRGQAAPFGAGEEIQFQWVGGTLYYNGSGETTDKAFMFQVPGEDNKLPNVFHAGPTGGVTFDGTDYTKTKWYANSTYGAGYAHDTRVILSGNNTQPMRVKCPVNNGLYLSVSPNPALTPYFLKGGSGTWTFENDASTMCGSFEIDDGTIGFTSIDETGYASSLGKSQHLYNFLRGKQTRAALDASKVSPFAVQLAATNATTRSTLDYIGEKSTGSSDRKIGLAGLGGKITSNGQGTLLMNGVTVRDSGLSTTLVVGGANTGENTLLNVTNGTGHIALVKEDAGKWILSDDVDIDSVEVKGGTLVLENPTGKSYTWFKFIMQEARNYNLDNGGSYTAASWPCLEEFILQDADGNRVFTNPTSDDVIVGGTASTSYRRIYNPINYHGIGPNSMAYGCRGEVDGGGYKASYPGGIDDRLATNLFDNAKSASAAGFWPSCYNGLYSWSTPTACPTTNTPNLWIEVVMRLPVGAPHVASCDLVAAIGGGWNNELSAWALEGCRDGIHWESITNYNSRYIMPAGGTTQKDGFNMHRNGMEYWSLVDKYGRTAGKSLWTPGETKAPYENGYPFPGIVRSTFQFLTALDYVKISGGGTLNIDSDTPVTIDDLTVDATTGGSILNGTYAKSGALKLENVGEGALITVPGTFDGLDITGWTVDLPQGAKGRTVVVKGGRITIADRGMLIIFR